MALLRPTQDVSAAQAAPTTTTWKEIPEQQFESAQSEPIDVVPFDVEPVTVTAAPTTAVAVPTTNHTDLASRGAVVATIPDFSEAGFEGVVIEALTFPIISLKTDGRFEDSEHNDYGREFLCRAKSSRPKTAVQGSKFENGRTDTSVFFTYDGIVTTTGQSCEELRQKYIAEGRTIVERPYLDVIVVMDAPGKEYDQDIRLLSVSPKSIARFNRALISLSMRKGWNAQTLAENIDSHVLKVEVGERVTGGVQPFWPWQFTFQR